jgi:hypothetical protein
MEGEEKPDRNVDPENKNNPGDDISGLWNEELKESCRALADSIRELDADTRQEVLEVLKLIGNLLSPEIPLNPTCAISTSAN